MITSNHLDTLNREEDMSIIVLSYNLAGSMAQVYPSSRKCVWVYPDEIADTKDIQLNK